MKERQHTITVTVLMCHQFICMDWISDAVHSPISIYEKQIIIIITVYYATQAAHRMHTQKFKKPVKHKKTNY